MKISDYDYELPEESIAHYPPEIRGSSRLLVLNKTTGKIEHKGYADLVDYLQAGDVIVLNNTKVLKARLQGVKPTGGKVELVVLERHDTETDGYMAMYRGTLKAGDLIAIGNYEVKVREVLGNGLIHLDSDVSLYEISEMAGQVPIPPYMNRESESLDETRYQTVFAKDQGSVAAPTASLNFTKEIEAKLIEKGVRIQYLTLHVGLGTFLPIRADNVEEHKMHSEHFVVPMQTVQAIRKAKELGKTIMAVGTTVTRTLEYCAEQIKDESINIDLHGEANIFIYPGYKFQVVTQLLTNFHAPRSTVLMLAAAFTGWDNLKNAYETAKQEKYNFLSYGDSMIITE
jgi:S-adenosylmethionine:tRNA ribosyltransferase-isomerase